jgi:hypothetical protein
MVSTQQGDRMQHESFPSCPSFKTAGAKGYPKIDTGRHRHQYQLDDVFVV